MSGIPDGAPHVTNGDAVVPELAAAARRGSHRRAGAARRATRRTGPGPRSTRTSSPASARVTSPDRPLARRHPPRPRSARLGLGRRRRPPPRPAPLTRAPLVRATPLADRVVGHPVPPPDRAPARRGDLSHQPLVRRPLANLPPAGPRHARAIPPAAALGRAVALCRRLRSKAGPAAQAVQQRPVLAATMRVERRCAIRADDPEVLQPVVVRHAVDVIQNERQRAPAPGVSLAAQLALRLLEPSASSRRLRWPWL